VRDTLNLIHDLSALGVGVRNLADPIRIDSSNPEDPMAQSSAPTLASRRPASPRGSSSSRQEDHPRTRRSGTQLGERRCEVGRFTMCAVAVAMIRRIGEERPGRE
jgi:hypothetical protein